MSHYIHIPLAGRSTCLENFRADEIERVIDSKPLISYMKKQSFGEVKRLLKSHKKLVSETFSSEMLFLC